jgi:hypothetical protein
LKEYSQFIKNVFNREYYCEKRGIVRQHLFPKEGVGNMESPLNSTSSNFEKVALDKFRSLAKCLPRYIKIFREPWGHSTVLCVDFENCPQLFPLDREQISLLAMAVEELGLANSVIFRIGGKIMGWKKLEK